MRLFSFPVLTVLVVTCLSGCSAKNNRVITQHSSPDGHHFYLMPVKEKGVTDITIAAAWNSDWFSSDDNNVWVPTVAANLLVNGSTSELSAAQVQELLADNNTRGNLYSSFDRTYAEVEFPNNHRSRVLPVLSELFQTPAFSEAWFNRFKSQQITRGNTEKETMSTLMWQASRHSVFKEGAQLKFLNANDYEALEALQLEEVERWYRDTLTRQPTAIVVTGAVNAKDAGTAVDALLFTPGAETVSMSLPLSYQPQTVYLHLPEVEKSVIGLLGVLPTSPAEDSIIDVIAASLMSDGIDSPLFTAVRTELGASYGVTAQVAAYSSSQRFLVISGEVETSKMSQARAAILDAYDRYVSKPDMSALGGFKEKLATHTRREQVYVSASAGMILDLVLAGRDAEDYYTLAEDIAELTAADVENRITNAFPRSTELAIFVAGPDPHAFPDACVITAPHEAADC